MKKCVLSFFVFFQLYSGFSQDSAALARVRELAKQEMRFDMTLDEVAEIMEPKSNRKPLYTIEVSELKNKNTKYNINGFDTWNRFIYTGTITEGIRRLFGFYPVSRLRIKGKEPEKRIFFKGERPDNWDSFSSQTIALGNNRLVDSIIDPVSRMILDILKSTYHFTVSNIEDTCEVWVAKVVNEEKLSNAVTKNNKTGFGGGQYTDKDNKKYYDIDYIGLFALWPTVGHFSKHIVYDKTNDTRKFTIEPFDTEILQDFDKINAALAPYGLQLFKEKRLEKLKLIEFHD